MALSPGLVQVRGGRFDLGGSPFAVVGANNYYLAYASTRMRADVLEVAGGLGFNVLRALAFLDCGAAKPGAVPDGAWRGAFFQYWNLDTAAPQVNEGENGLQQLDHLIADADAAGIRLILPLVNHWPDFGGMDRYVGWFQAGSRDQFYRNAAVRGAYQNYVHQVLTRRNTVTGRLYKDEPAILAWELANEPQCNTPDGRRVLLDWMRDMSRWAKRCDPNHLLAVGDEGHFANGSGDLYDGSHGVDCEAFLQIPEIDFGTFHMYPQTWKQPDPILFGIRWIEQHLAAGRDAGKPMLLEEYGMTVASDGLPSALQRNFVYRYWLHTVLAQKGAGDLAWMIASTDDATGSPYPDYDHFTFYAASEVPSIRNHVLQVTQGAPAEALPVPDAPPADQGVVDLWVTDRSGVFLDEKQAQVVLKRDGEPIGYPLTLDFSGGPVQLNVPALPAGEFVLEIQPQNYQPCSSDPFRIQAHERIFVHATTGEKA